MCVGLRDRASSTDITISLLDTHALIWMMDAVGYFRGHLTT